MNRSIKAFALAAFALAAAFGATAAQASANFTVNFKVQNADTNSANSMIRTSTLPSTVTGLIAPAASIASMSFDPNSGTASYGDALPGPGHTTQVDITYALAIDGVSSPCTFTILVGRDNNALQPYYVHFSNNGVSRCVVPGDARSSNGAFAGSFTLSWKT
ncbi:MAG: hypothetical protein QOJ39_2923 [Candidatus Eremiobacteraeota bacterium]|jgi:hypothetical protein|nr:hypothetical protein [Candidatus Eremiobacteraeota bacterium]